MMVLTVRFKRNEGVFLVKMKNACFHRTRLRREHISMNFNVPRGSELSEWASLWKEQAGECSEAECCVASEESEPCERINVASDRVAN